MIVKEGIEALQRFMKLWTYISSVLMKWIKESLGNRLKLEDKVLYESNIHGVS